MEKYCNVGQGIDKRTCYGFYSKGNGPTISKLVSENPMIGGTSQ